MEWYAVIADTHLNFQEASDSADRKLHPSFGDGPAYRKYVINLLKELNTKGIKTIGLGDVIDDIQTQGTGELLNCLYSFDEEWARKKVNENKTFRSALKDYVELVKLLKSENCVYVPGNHEDPYKMKELGIDSKDEIYLGPLRFVHGHKHNLPVNLFGFNPGQFFHRAFSQRMPSKEENKPFERKIASFMKFLSRFIGWGGLIVDNGVKNLISKLYGEKKDGISELRNDTYSSAYRHSRSYMSMKHYTPFVEVNNERKPVLTVMGDEHKPSLHKNGVVVGDAYHHGISFVGYDEKNAYVVLGMKKSDKEYFEKGHVWKYSLGKRAWKFIQEISGSEFARTLTSYEAVAQDGPFQKAQAASPE